MVKIDAVLFLGLAGWRAGQGEMTLPLLGQAELAPALPNRIMAVHLV